jgi:hypothetical protein
MTSKIAERNLPPVKNLKQSFECAVRDIYQVSLTGKASQYRTPIVQRAGASLSPSSVDVKQRAVADAAKALALLWKISPHSGR